MDFEKPTPEKKERARIEAWEQARDYADPEKITAARSILLAMAEGVELRAALHKFPARNTYLSKDFLVQTYFAMVREGTLASSPEFLARIRMKPIRTLSGVATVAVLTKPHPCPGECLFCPDDERMPKSYIADEPGALRAAQHGFDPYEQVRSRLLSLQAVGHAVDKVELLILGGSWTAYSPEYRECFAKRCFDAINGFDSTDLIDAQKANESSGRRNVGFVVETRPDHITPATLREMRRLGVTKVQIGVQSVDDSILRANCRGHTVEQTRQGFRLLRAAGFKIHAHWMPNLFLATPISDRTDFRKLWEDPGLRPDEIKIYPTVLVKESALYEKFLSGEYKPYSYEELLALIVDIKQVVPEYCRISRLARDIPAHHVVSGNTRSNLREDAQRILIGEGKPCRCIRCREVRNRKVTWEELAFRDMRYSTADTGEHFLSFVTDEDKLAGYLRLSLPEGDAPKLGWKDLDGAALIREVHIYGPLQSLGEVEAGAAQHKGLGTELLIRAETLAKEAGFSKISVISAIGTKEYYRGRGYQDGELYLSKKL